MTDEFQGRSAAEIVERHMRRIRFCRMLNIALLVMLAAAVFLFMVDRLGIAQIFIAYGAVVAGVLLLRVQLRRYTGEIGCILTHACDPVKYTGVWKRLAAYERTPSGKTGSNLCIAQGLYFQGDADGALGLLYGASFPKPVPGIMLPYYSILAGCHAVKKNTAQLEKVREQLSGYMRGMRQSGKPAQTAQSLLKSIDASLALSYGSLKECRKLVEELAARSACPLEKVSCDCILGNVDLKEGRISEGRERLERVARDGGSSYYAAEARELLAGLDP